MRHAGGSESEPGCGVRFSEALRFWLKLGFISFGGPAGQIAILHREVVERRRWIGESRFLHALNYCMLLPGPEAQQLATYIGWLLHGTRGGLAAGILFVLPSVFILFGLSYLYAAYGELALVAGLLSGFKSVVVALVADAVVRIGRRAIRGWPHLLVASLAFISLYFLRVPFPLIILAAALIGLAGVRQWPETWVPVAATSSPVPSHDDLSLPHTTPSPRHAILVIATGLILWALPFILLAMWLGWESLPLRQYGFFTGAALVTFGGAYAVLAYVTHAAVQDFGWISHSQAVDGLALAETTPGPLIMVLQFIGFMTGWNHPGEMSRLAAATLGALVTTWATFLPCFIFVFIGAPWMEQLRGNRTLNGALSGVTASVIGAVLSLALVFGAAVIIPEGVSGGIRVFPAILAAAAFLALASRRIDSVWIVLGGGLAGVVGSQIFR